MKAYVLSLCLFCFSVTAFSQSTPYIKMQGVGALVWAADVSQENDSSDVLISDKRVGNGLIFSHFTINIREQQFKGDVNQKMWDKEHKAPEPLCLRIGFTIKKITIVEGPIILISPLTSKKRTFATNATVTIE